MNIKEKMLKDDIKEKNKIIRELKKKIKDYEARLKVAIRKAEAYDGVFDEFDSGINKMTLREAKKLLANRTEKP